MSVLIKGFSLPLKCDFCPLEYFDGDLFHGCALIFNKSTNDVRKYKRLDDCPLVELPEKRGRLIDADVLCKDLSSFYDGEVTARQLIAKQPTVIDAEGEP